MYVRMYVCFLNAYTDVNQSWYMYHLDLPKEDHVGMKFKGRFLPIPRSNIKIRKPF